MSREKLGKELLSHGLVTASQLQAAQEHRTKTKSRLLSSLVKLGHVNERVLITFLSRQYGIPAVSLEGVKIPAEIMEMIPVSLCDKHGMIPLSMDGNRIQIAISDPSNVAATDDVRFLTSRDVEVCLATETAIRQLIERNYSRQQLKLDPELVRKDEGVPTAERLEFNTIGRESISLEDKAGDERPVIRLINQIFVEAIRRKASDIHIEPFEDHTRVRFRTDGALNEVMQLPSQFRLSVPARIKVMSTLDISEKRLPQDGRMQVKIQDRPIDIRISVLPTVFGEKVVLRLLDQGATTAVLSESGFEKEQLTIFRQASSEPYGMVLVTGPTGSGKSTTLYGILSELNNPDSNISTVEDPVEYNIEGVNQVQMKENIGLTFANALRSLLRQDPDIIMVGEIRDQETAEIAVKAALTGHMVFSTLHTNDAPSSISRLIHMGIEPFLITASITLIQAQRLVRVLCDKCKEPDVKVTREMLLRAGVAAELIGTFKPLHGRGCENCAGTGYRGRIGIFEVMPMTEEIRELVIRGANADLLKKKALEQGMMTLRQAALVKLMRGMTTFEEVLNNSRSDEDLETV